MHTTDSNVSLYLGQQIRTASREVLALGIDMDGRGLHWRLAKDIAPQLRLEFSLAVFFSQGLYVLIAADRGFLCVERIAQRYHQLIKARQSGSYLIGHAFAKLLDALGYGENDTAAFDLIEEGDLANPTAFIKGFSDCVAQSMEWDIARVVRGQHRKAARSGAEVLVDNLRSYVAEHVGKQYH